VILELEEDEIREKKLSELKKKYAEQQQNEKETAEAENRLDLVLRQVLEPEAKSRLSNVKLVNRELYLKATQAIVYLVNNGRVSGKISDAQLKNLLEQMIPRKKEISIRRIEKKI